MSNTTGIPTPKYYEWLQSSAEQAKVPKIVLAACQLRAAWILSGCPIGGIKLEEADTEIARNAEHVQIYQQVLERVTRAAAAHMIKHDEMTRARMHVQMIPFNQVIELSNTDGMFDKIAPEVVLVMDVMQS